MLLPATIIAAVGALALGTSPVSSTYDAPSDTSTARVQAIKPSVVKGDCTAWVEVSSSWKGGARGDAAYKVDVVRWTMNFQRWSPQSQAKLVVDGRRVATTSKTWESHAIETAQCIGVAESMTLTLPASAVAKLARGRRAYVVVGKDRIDLSNLRVSALLNFVKSSQPAQR